MNSHSHAAIWSDLLVRLNELTRLRAYTHEQEKAGVDDEWFKQLVYGVRNSLSTLVPDAEAVQVDVEQA